MPLALKLEHDTDAEPVLRECLKIRVDKQPDAWSTFYSQSQLGASLLGQKKYVEAEPLLQAGHDGMQQREAKIPANYRKFLTEALERLVQLYDTLGQTGASERVAAEVGPGKNAHRPPVVARQSGRRTPKEVHRIRILVKSGPVLRYFP